MHGETVKFVGFQAVCTCCFGNDILEVRLGIAMEVKRAR